MLNNTSKIRTQIKNGAQVDDSELFEIIESFRCAKINHSGYENVKTPDFNELKEKAGDLTYFIARYEDEIVGLQLVEVAAVNKEGTFLDSLDSELRQQLNPYNPPVTDVHFNYMFRHFVSFPNMPEHGKGFGRLATASLLLNLFDEGLDIQNYLGGCFLQLLTPTGDSIEQRLYNQKPVRTYESLGFVLTQPNQYSDFNRIIAENVERAVFYRWEPELLLDKWSSFVRAFDPVAKGYYIFECGTFEDYSELNELAINFMMVLIGEGRKVSNSREETRQDGESQDKGKVSND